MENINPNVNTGGVSRYATNFGPRIQGSSSYLLGCCFGAGNQRNTEQLFDIESQGQNSREEPLIEGMTEGELSQITNSLPLEIQHKIEDLILRVNTKDKKTIFTIVNSHAYDFTANFMFYIFVSSIVEAAIIGDVRINNPSVNEYFKTTLPNEISNTGETLLVGVLTPTILTTIGFSIPYLYRGLKNYCYSNKKPSTNKSIGAKKNEHAIQKGINEFRQFFWFFTTGQSIKLLASLEIDIWKTNYISGFLGCIPGSLQFIQGGIAAGVHWATKKQKPVLFQDGFEITGELRQED